VLLSDAALNNTLNKKPNLQTSYTKFEPFEGPALIIEQIYVNDEASQEPKIEIEEIEVTNIQVDDKSDLGFLYDDYIDENDM
jgi:hypothetical protein